LRRQDALVKVRAVDGASTAGSPRIPAIWQTEPIFTGFFFRIVIFQIPLNFLLNAMKRPEGRTWALRLPSAILKDGFSAI